MRTKINVAETTFARQSLLVRIKSDLTSGLIAKGPTQQNIEASHAGEQWICYLVEDRVDYRKNRLLQLKYQTKLTIPRERSTLVDVKTAQDHRLTLKCARVLLSERSQFFCCWTARLWDDTGPPGRSQNVLCGGRPSNETVPWCSLGVVGCVTKDCRQKWVCLRHSPAFLCCTVALIIIFKLISIPIFPNLNDV